jgi:hypothetical protein
VEFDPELELFERIRRLPELLRLLFFRESNWHCYDHDTLPCRRCFELASLLSKEEPDAL